MQDTFIDDEGNFVFSFTVDGVKHTIYIFWDDGVQAFSLFVK